jgi:hypothetical protein
MADVAYFLKMMPRFGKNRKLSSDDIEGASVLFFLCLVTVRFYAVSI